MDIETISCDELKAKLDNGDDFKLVMTMNEWAFDAADIPGSLNIYSVEDGAQLLGIDDETVVYCSDGDLCCQPDGTQGAGRRWLREGSALFAWPNWPGKRRSRPRRSLR